MSWNSDRVLNNNAFLNKQSKIIFMQLNDIEYNYTNHTLPLSMFTKMKQDGTVDIDRNGIVKVNVNTKIMIEINIFYTYSDAEFAHRYQLNIYKNNVLINTYYCGMNDTTITTNNIYIVSVLDVVNDDVIKIYMVKSNIENSINKIKILKNSFINYKTF